MTSRPDDKYGTRVHTGIFPPRYAKVTRETPVVVGDEVTLTFTFFDFAEGSLVQVRKVEIVCDQYGLKSADVLENGAP
jgi:hypothetical protein